VNIQLNVPARPAYRYKFTRDNVVVSFYNFLLSLSHHPFPANNSVNLSYNNALCGAPKWLKKPSSDRLSPLKCVMACYE